MMAGVEENDDLLENYRHLLKRVSVTQLFNVCYPFSQNIAHIVLISLSSLFRPVTTMVRGGFVFLPISIIASCSFSQRNLRLEVVSRAQLGEGGLFEPTTPSDGPDVTLALGALK